MIRTAVLAVLASGPATSLADTASAPVASKLPPPSKLISKHKPTSELGIVQAAGRRSVRVCADPAPDCQYTDLGAAVSAALPGWEIVLAPGVYAQGAVLATDGLTLRGEPGAHLKGHPVQRKAALVVKGAGVVIDGIECSGIEVPDKNGACIRIEGPDLTVRNVYFHDNQQGILSGPGGGTVLVENSRFERNGHAGRAHGIYIGREVESFIFRGNVVLSTKSEGHGVKSRARKAVIEDNVIASLEGDDSRAIDLSNGGEAVIRRNLLEKGPKSANSQMIGIALEKPFHPANKVVIEQNLIVFDPPQSELQKLLSALGKRHQPRGTVVLSRSPGEVVLRDNVIVGARKLGVPAEEAENVRFLTRNEAKLSPYPDVSRSLLDLIPIKHGTSSLE